mmetsp:Transcript_5240/g.15944  ORF Transcript_5240/g.15944 Transcript_5240/m.15944 type:complete len:311 (-) Transcript_5240:154-1086(-)
MFLRTFSVVWGTRRCTPRPYGCDGAKQYEDDSHHRQRNNQVGVVVAVAVVVVSATRAKCSGGSCRGTCWSACCSGGSCRGTCWSACWSSCWGSRGRVGPPYAQADGPVIVVYLCRAAYEPRVRIVLYITRVSDIGVDLLLTHETLDTNVQTVASIVAVQVDVIPEHEEGSACGCVARHVLPALRTCEDVAVRRYGGAHSRHIVAQPQRASPVAPRPEHGCGGGELLHRVPPGARHTKGYRRAKTPNNQRPSESARESPTGLCPHCASSPRLGGCHGSAYDCAFSRRDPIVVAVCWVAPVALSRVHPDHPM